MEQNQPSGKMAEALFKALIRGYEKAYYNQKARKSRGGGWEVRWLRVT